MTVKEFSSISHARSRCVSAKRSYLMTIRMNQVNTSQFAKGSKRYNKAESAVQDAQKSLDTLVIPELPIQPFGFCFEHEGIGYMAHTQDLDEAKDMIEDAFGAISVKLVQKPRLYEREGITYN